MMYAVVFYAHDEVAVSAFGPYRSRGKAEEAEQKLLDRGDFDPDSYNSAVVMMERVWS